MASPVALALALLLGGCGDGGDPSDPAEEETVDGGSPAMLVELEVDVPEPLRSGEPVTWEVDVTNPTDEEMVLTFPDGRSADVTLTDLEANEEAYRWSDGQMFTQAVREEPLAAGETQTFELEEPSLDVEPGSYGLAAHLTAEEAPAPVLRVVEVE